MGYWKFDDDCNAMAFVQLYSTKTICARRSSPSRLLQLWTDRNEIIEMDRKDSNGR